MILEELLQLGNRLPKAQGRGDDNLRPAARDDLVQDLHAG
jgi:hypothetical protein